MQMKYSIDIRWEMYKDRIKFARTTPRTKIAHSIQKKN